MSRDICINTIINIICCKNNYFENSIPMHDIEEGGLYTVYNIKKSLIHGNGMAFIESCTVSYSRLQTSVFTAFPDPDVFDSLYIYEYFSVIIQNNLYCYLENLNGTINI